MVDPITATKAAGGFMKALQQEPLALALCVMNFALIGFLYVQSAAFTSQRDTNVKLFIDVQREVQKLLSECIVPAPPQRQRGQLPEDPNSPISISRPDER